MARTTEQVAAGAADFVSASIENAKSLIEAKRSIQSDIQTARDFLNQAVKMGATTDEQTAWINENLPKRTRVRKNGDTADTE